MVLAVSAPKTCKVCRVTMAAYMFRARRACRRCDNVLRRESRDRCALQGLLKPGEYARIRGVWHCCTPSNHLGNLGNHDVTEHEDGTITVSPSILVFSEDGKGNRNEHWHGYLQAGVWREV